MGSINIMTLHEPILTIGLEIDEKIHVVTKSTVTLPPHHIAVVPLTPINYPDKMQANTLPEIKENPFHSVEQLNITIKPDLQKLDSRTPDKFMAILWNPGDHSISIKKNMTIGFMKELDYIKQFKADQQGNIREVAEIS